MRIGVIIRYVNWGYLVLTSLCTSISHLTKPIVVEARTLIRATQPCLEFGLSNVVFEGEFKMKTKTTNSQEKFKQIMDIWSMILKDYSLEGQIGMSYSITEKLIWWYL